MKKEKEKNTKRWDLSMDQYNQEFLEQSLIGCCLRDKDFCTEVVQELMPIHFMHPDTSKLFKAIKRLVDNGESVDESSLAKEASCVEFSFSRAISLSVECSHKSTGSRGDHVLQAMKESHAIFQMKELAKAMINFENKEKGSTAAYLDRVKESIASIQIDQSCEITSPSISMLRHGVDENGKYMSFMDVVEKRVRDKEAGIKTLPGISYGVETMDKLTGGIKPGSITILGGRTGVGKTQFVLDLIRKWCEAGIPVGLFSQEMSLIELDVRVVSQVSSITAKQIEEGNLSKQDLDRLRKAQDKHMSHNISYIENSGLTPSQIRSSLYKMKQTKGIKIAVIDYLTLMNSDKKSSNNTEKYGDIIKSLQQIAKCLKIPLVILVQLNRDGDKEELPPRNADIKESSCIEQVADTIIFVHRDSYYQTQKIQDFSIEKPNAFLNEVEIMITKIRGRGGKYTVPMIFEEDGGRYVEKTQYC